MTPHTETIVRALAKLAASVKACHATRYTMDAMWHEVGLVICAAARYHDGTAGPDEIAVLVAFAEP